MKRCEGKWIESLCLRRLDVREGMCAKLLLGMI